MTLSNQNHPNCKLYSGLTVLVQTWRTAGLRDAHSSDLAWAAARSAVGARKLAARCRGSFGESVRMNENPGDETRYDALRSQWLRRKR